MQCDGEKCECVKVIEDLEKQVSDLNTYNERLKMWVDILTDMLTANKLRQAQLAFSYKTKEKGGV